MFRIIEDIPSGSLLQCLAKITKMDLSCPLIRTWSVLTPTTSISTDTTIEAWGKTQAGTGQQDSSCANKKTVATLLVPHCLILCAACTFLTEMSLLCNVTWIWVTICYYSLCCCFHVLFFIISCCQSLRDMLLMLYFVNLATAGVNPSVICNDCACKWI